MCNARGHIMSTAEKYHDTCYETRELKYYHFIFIVHLHVACAAHMHSKSYEIRYCPKVWYYINRCCLSIDSKLIKQHQMSMHQSGIPHQQKLISSTDLFPETFYVRNVNLGAVSTYHDRRLR